MTEMLTDSTKEAIAAAQATAAEFGEEQVGSEHLLIGILLDPDSTAALALTRVGVDLPPLYEQLANRPPTLGALQPEQSPAPSSEMQNILTQASNEAQMQGEKYVAPEHLLLALAESSSLAEFFARYDIDPASIRTVVSNMTESSQVTGTQDPFTSTPDADADFARGPLLDIEGLPDIEIAAQPEMQSAEQVNAQNPDDMEVFLKQTVDGRLQEAMVAVWGQRGYRLAAAIGQHREMNPDTRPHDQELYLAFEKIMQE